MFVKSHRCCVVDMGLTEAVSQSVGSVCVLNVERRVAGPVLAAGVKDDDVERNELQNYPCLIEQLMVLR
jgi:hypothetical protein